MRQVRRLQPVRRINPVRHVTSAKPTKVLWVTGITFDKPKGDWAQTCYQIRSLEAQGIIVDIIHPPPPHKELFNCLKSESAKHFITIDIALQTRQLWDTGEYFACIARGPKITAMISHYIPQKKLFTYIYGHHFSEDIKALKSAWQKSHRIIVQGDGQIIHAMEKGLDVSKIVSIPCTVDYKSFNTVKVIGYVGSLYQFQCLDLIIDVVEKLRSEFNVRLLVIGSMVSSKRRPDDFPWETKLVHKLNSTRWIDWIKVAPPRMLPTLYRAMDAMISLSTPGMDQPNTYCDNLIKTKLLEAMSAGVPIICNRSWGNTYLLGEEYEYFSEDVDAATATTKEVLSNHHPGDDISKRLQERASRFSLEIIGQRFLHAIK